MPLSCKEQQFKVEEEVLQPIDTWVNKQVEECRSEPCNWWMLCLNRLVCWLVTVLVKVIEWVLVIVVRWVYRTVCVIVSILLGLVLLVVLNTEVLAQALSDAWQLIVDAFFQVVGLIIFVALNVVDAFQGVFNLQSDERKLTELEIATLRPIFGESLQYWMIRVIDGNQGLLTPAQGAAAMTIGFRIYSTNPSLITIVHECVHVWQFQFGGAHYIGQSALYQGWHMIFGGDDPYDWESRIGPDDNAWYLLDSVEAQAEFIEDVYTDGEFVPSGGTPVTVDGAFFRRDKTGQNQFVFGNTGPVTDYTARANAAWDVVRIG